MTDATTQTLRCYTAHGYLFAAEPGFGYADGEEIRPATPEESAACDANADALGGFGEILVRVDG
jgi:hypothetical protein